MQLISCSTGLRIEIRGERENFTPKGDRLPTSPALSVQFVPAGGGVPDHLKAEVEKIPGYRQGLGRDEDPETRIGWWDSRVAQSDLGWSDVDHDYVVERLRTIGDPNILEVTEVQVLTPYAKYDTHRKTQGKRTLEHVFKDISETYDLAGFDIEQAVAYERQNQNDEKVIDFLRGLGVQVDATEELIPA